MTDAHDNSGDEPVISRKEQERAEREARKAQALRDNLRRRKTSVKNRKE